MAPEQTVVRTAELIAAFAAAYDRAPTRSELAACRWVRQPDSAPADVITAMGAPPR